MQINILENGNLEMILESGDKDEIAAMTKRDIHLDHGVLSEILDHFGFLGNGQFSAVMPEVVGGLTDSPIIVDNFELDDSGNPISVGNTWWFPNYMVESFAETLIETGRVVFTAAPENEPKRKICGVKP